MDKEYYYSPIGVIELQATGRSLTSLKLIEGYKAFTASSNPVIKETISQLSEYFAGQRQQFHLPLQLQGTEFQKQVWNQLMEIPYGKTISYAELAQAIGNPKACRAVGSANGKNPIAIIVPCHRVIASDKSLGGYAYGLAVKQHLLKLEEE